MAAVDAGSNAIRFVAVEVGEEGVRRELAALRAAVRMGHQAFRTGRLAAETMAAAVDALAGFRRRMDELGVVRYRAVATSAVRESENGGELVARAASEAGLELEVIDGAEEARLVWRAVEERLPLDGRWLLVDLGGGSLEVSVVGDGGVASTGSYPLGAVRLIEELEVNADAGDRRGDTRRRVETLAAERTSGVDVPALGADTRGLLASGGNIETLAELAGAPRDRAGVARLPLATLRATIAAVAKLSPDDRVRSLRLREDRADVIVPAGWVYAWVADRAGVDEVVVPNVGVKEGLLAELAG